MHWIRGRCAVGAISVILSGLFDAGLARVPYPLAPYYEGKQRILVLWDSAAGQCPGNPDVGRQTLDFVIASLDTAYVSNVRILRSETATLPQVQSLWPGFLPLVLVHINAGDTGTNANLTSVITWAVQNYVGIVEVGDAPAAVASAAFGLQYLSGASDPMGDAQWLDKHDDSLWIKLRVDRDQIVDSTWCPYLTGIVRNAARVAQRSSLLFKPVGPNGRCGADVQEFAATPNGLNSLTLLGYQQGRNAAADQDDPTGAGVVGEADQWNAIVAFQDSVMYATGFVIRRGAVLAFQPQFLQDSLAAQQLVYDAVMYLSLLPVVYGLKPMPPVDTLIAGDTAKVPTGGTPFLYQFSSDSILPGDTVFLLDGGTALVTATAAFHTMYVFRSWFDTSCIGTPFEREDPAATFWVVPAADRQVCVEAVSTNPGRCTGSVPYMPYADSITARSLDSIVIPYGKDTVYACAVVRDEFGNIKRAATNAVWSAVGASGAVQVAQIPGRQFEGKIVRVYQGEDTIVCGEPGLVPDTVRVVVRAGTGVRSQSAHTDLALSVTGISAVPSQGCLAVGVTVPRAIRSLRVEVIDLTGRTVGHVSLIDPRPGRFSVAVASGLPARGVCVVRVRATAKDHVEVLTRRLPLAVE